MLITLWPAFASSIVVHDACGAGSVDACAQLVRHHATQVAFDAMTGPVPTWRLRAIQVAADQHLALKTGKKPACFFLVPACGEFEDPPFARPETTPIDRPPPKSSYYFLDSDGSPLFFRRATDESGNSVDKPDLTSGTYEFTGTIGLTSHLHDMYIVQGTMVLPEPGNAVTIAKSFEGQHPTVKMRVLDPAGVPLSGVVVVAWSSILQNYYTPIVAWDGWVTLPTDHEGNVRAWIPEHTTSFDMGSPAPTQLTPGPFERPPMSEPRRAKKPKRPITGRWKARSGDVITVDDVSWDGAEATRQQIGPGVFTVDTSAGNCIAVQIGKKLVVISSDQAEVFESNR